MGVRFSTAKLPREKPVIHKPVVSDARCSFEGVVAVSWSCQDTPDTDRYVAYLDTTAHPLTSSPHGSTVEIDRTDDVQYAGTKTSRSLFVRCYAWDGTYVDSDARQVTVKPVPID